jgi:DNA-binding transcriptional ArsR family regulator
MLPRERPHTVGELMAAVDMEQSAVSHQLRVLREYGLVVAERRGRERLYALHDEHVPSLLDEAVGHVAHLGPSAKLAANRTLRDAG